MGTPAQQFDEWCPKCGNGVDELNPVTGFCAACTELVFGTRTCTECGNEFVPYQKSRTTCLSCRREQWFKRNADAIERVMIHRRCIASVAIIAVADDNRPRCAMCGDKIKHGTKGRTLFCKKKDACRRASIRYHNYRKRNHLSDDEALERAIHGKRKK